MNALIIFNGSERGDAKGISQRIHYNFLLKTAKIFDRVTFYGPSEKNHPLASIPYSTHTSIDQIVEKSDASVILVFSFFCCAAFLPPGFGRYNKIPKICIEVDYWNVRNKNWYVNQKFDFIIQRGYYQKSKIESVWLPFSCCEDIPPIRLPLDRKIKRIAFVGRGFKEARGGKYYPIRRAAIAVLKRHSLIDVIGTVGHLKYPKSIAKYMCYLSDTGRVKSPPAKTFEIMGAGSLLFTTPFHGANRLFGDKQFCIYYVVGNIRKKARSILGMSRDRIAEIIGNATTAIDAQHLDQHRLEELQLLLSTYIKKKRILRKWQV